MSERVRIEAPDVKSATALMHRLRDYDCRLVVHERGACEVSVRSSLTGREANRLIDRVLDGVEGWLQEHGFDAVTVHVDGEPYSMPRSRPAEQIL